MASISLCMIVKNEENTLDRCLGTIKNMVDEIIIVDTGSTDNTIEVAKRYTDQIYEFVWIDDFSAARNFAFQYAKMDYVLTMDADDTLSEEESQKLLLFKKTLSPSVDAVTMKCLAGFDESGNVLASLRQIRMVRREKQFKWKGAVHEYLDVEGNIVHSDIAVTHKRIHQSSDRNLKIYENQLKNGTPLTPRDLYYYANELFDHSRYQQAIKYYLEFLQTKNGWMEDVIQAYGKIGDSFAQLEDIGKAIFYTLQAFNYGPPRAEFCCRLGLCFLQQERPDIAVNWFRFATQLPTIDYGGVINHGCSTWIPNLQLGVCYYQLGDYQKAWEHNEMARSFNPYNPFIKENKVYLENLLKQS